MSFTVTPAFAIALQRAASTPRWDDATLSGIRRTCAPDPVRWTIHSSDVSIRRVSSSFFTTRFGRARPVPMIPRSAHSLSIHHETSTAAARTWLYSSFTDGDCVMLNER